MHGNGGYFVHCKDRRNFHRALMKAPGEPITAGASALVVGLDRKTPLVSLMFE